MPNHHDFVPQFNMDSAKTIYRTELFSSRAHKKKKKKKKKET